MKKIYIIILAVIVTLLLNTWYIIAMWKGVIDHTARDAIFEVTKDAVWHEYSKHPFPSRHEATQALTAELAQHPVPPLNDRWGTPYHVEISEWSITGGVAVIRSAGSDRTLHTPDDLVATIETHGRREDSQQEN